jgi:thiamine-monophosphate kinase
VSGLGEFELIEELARHLDPPLEGLGIGDDAAAWTPSPGALAVATTDMLVEGIHFRLDWTSPRDLGWKALAVNLSDLAAMGARPGHALISLALLPDQAPLVAELYDGVRELAALTGTQIVGGDTVRTPGPLVINVALCGEAEPGRLLRRDAAEPGDLLVVTGPVGASAAGLALLYDAGAAALAGNPTAGPLLAAHRRPVPQLQAGKALADIGLRCAIDISDGVASEAMHLARSSGVEIEIDAGALPLAPEAVELLGEERARGLAISGGEDYELLFCVGPDRLDEARAALPPTCRLVAVGRVLGRRAGGSVEVTLAGEPLGSAAAGYTAF